MVWCGVAWVGLDAAAVLASVPPAVVDGTKWSCDVKEVWLAREPTEISKPHPVEGSSSAELEDSLDSVEELSGSQLWEELVHSLHHHGNQTDAAAVTELRGRLLGCLEEVTADPTAEPAGLTGTLQAVERILTHKPSSPGCSYDVIKGCGLLEWITTLFDHLCKVGVASCWVGVALDKVTRLLVLAASHVLVSLSSASKVFTTEDVITLTCHGCLHVAQLVHNSHVAASMNVVEMLSSVLVAASNWPLPSYQLLMKCLLERLDVRKVLGLLEQTQEQPSAELPLVFLTHLAHLNSLWAEHILQGLQSEAGSRWLKFTLTCRNEVLLKETVNLLCCLLKHSPPSATHCIAAASSTPDTPSFNTVVFLERVCEWLRPAPGEVRCLYGRLLATMERCNPQLQIGTRLRQNSELAQLLRTCVDA